MNRDDLGINPADYAALSNFLRGYLHQDVAAEYGSPEAAARQFRKDADERETAIVHSELDRLLSETASLALFDLSRALEQLGSSWRFRTRREVEQLRNALK